MQTCTLPRVLTPVSDSMVLITDKFWGPEGAENVIGSVHLWLAEAVSTLQDNRDAFTAKVRAAGEVGMGGVSQTWPRAPPGPLWSPPGHPGLWEPQGEPSQPRV